MKPEDRFWEGDPSPCPYKHGKEVMKESVTLKIDETVLAWFRSRGRGYGTRINTVLTEFYEEHRDACNKRN